jgi:CRISPR/Cas system CMR subunit Cmr6 (Cas7 group RAMP superfamily)
MRLPCQWYRPNNIFFLTFHSGRNIATVLVPELVKVEEFNEFRWKEAINELTD